MMVNTGLATYNSDGTLNYQPETTSTMIVIIGDNGTFAPEVKPPFDYNRAKGYVNQTGVWVPLIVAGPLVNGPGRQISAMVNIADLFQFFGEIAGIDVHKEVPKSHRLDSQAMLPPRVDERRRQVLQPRRVHQIPVETTNPPRTQRPSGDEEMTTRVHIDVRECSKSVRESRRLL